MKYVCDAGTNTWFRMETAHEAALESQAMNHAVERFFRDIHEKVLKSYKPAGGLRAIEQSIGREDFIQLTMPMFLTLRDINGEPLVTAMLPPPGKDERAFRPIIVGPATADPYPAHGDAIAALGRQLQTEARRRDVLSVSAQVRVAPALGGGAHLPKCPIRSTGIPLDPGPPPQGGRESERTFQGWRKQHQHW